MTPDFSDVFFTHTTWCSYAQVSVECVFYAPASRWLQRRQTARTSTLVSDPLTNPLPHFPPTSRPFSPQQMVRLYKTYIFPFSSKSATAATTVMFSGYPGVLEGIDDFYTTSANVRRDRV